MSLSELADGDINLLLLFTHSHTLFLCNICFSDITWIQPGSEKCSRMSMQTKKTADVPVVTVINSLFIPLPVMCFQRQMEGGGPFIFTELSSDRLGMTFCWVMECWTLGLKELWVNRGLREVKDHSLSILLWLSLGPTHYKVPQKLHTNMENLLKSLGGFFVQSLQHFHSPYGPHHLNSPWVLPIVLLSSPPCVQSSSERCICVFISTAQHQTRTLKPFSEVKFCLTV